MDVMYIGIGIPLLGGVLGAACVFFCKRLNKTAEKVLSGFASGIMISASVWSLIVPALNLASDLGKFSFIPCVSGFLAGILFLLFLDNLIPHLHNAGSVPEGIKSSFSRRTMMLLAVTIHNFPEGMAVGTVLAGILSNETSISTGAFIALALGIAIQNFPEGAVTALPLYEKGMRKGHAFILSVLSSLVEPLGTILVLLLSNIFIPVLPAILGFAAGAMIYVVIDELIPEMSEGGHSNLSIVAFSLGFSLMMVLDIALG